MSQLIWNERVWSALWPACDKNKERTQFKIYFTLNFIMNMKTMTYSRAGIFPGWISFLFLAHSLLMFHQSFDRFIEFTFNSSQWKKRFIQMQISVWTTVFSFCFCFGSSKEKHFDQTNTEKYLKLDFRAISLNVLRWFFLFDVSSLIFVLCICRFIHLNNSWLEQNRTIEKVLDLDFPKNTYISVSSW